MKIKFCGAAREITGSAHLITLADGYTILLDCGLYQGRDKEMSDFNQNWGFDPSTVDCLILSHAHIDHSGRIPKLVKDGFNGNIYCTHATRSLCNIMLLDSAKIQERDAYYQNKRGNQKIAPLYTSIDAHKAMESFVGFGYNKWFSISDGIRVQFRDAGHILGSASVSLEIRENGKLKRIGFTGDIGRPERPILRDPQVMPQCDYLICESTYGNKDHLNPPKETGKLLDIINDVCVKNQGKLIIPAFSIGRTQEIVHMLDRLEHEGKLPKIPVYVDSPLAVNATMIFGNHPECFDQEMHEYMLLDQNPFGFNKLFYIREVAQSKDLNNRKEACIIISASGMANAGRVKHHLSNSVENPKNGVLIVGYCAPYTPGGMLRDGAKKITLFGKPLNVNCAVHTMDSFSAHGDRSEMRDFIQGQKGHAKKIFLVHGTLDRQEEFKSYLEDAGFQNIEIPSLGDEFNI